MLVSFAFFYFRILQCTSLLVLESACSWHPSITCLRSLWQHPYPYQLWGRFLYRFVRIKETNMTSNDDLTADVINQYTLFPKAVTRQSFSGLFLGHALASCHVVFDRLTMYPRLVQPIQLSLQQNGDLVTYKTRMAEKTMEPTTETINRALR